MSVTLERVSVSMKVHIDTELEIVSRVTANTLIAIYSRQTASELSYEINDCRESE